MKNIALIFIICISMSASVYAASNAADWDDDVIKVQEELKSFIQSQAEKQKIILHMPWQDKLQAFTITQADERRIKVSFSSIKLGTMQLTKPWSNLKAADWYDLAVHYYPRQERENALTFIGFCIGINLKYKAKEQITLLKKEHNDLEKDLSKELDYLAQNTRSKTTAKRKKKSKKKKELGINTPDPLKTVLEKLGKRHFMVGMTSSPNAESEAWIKETQGMGARWDMRYQYLSGGVTGNRTWKDWNQPAGSFADRYINASIKLKCIPVFSWYQIYQSSPGHGAGSEPLAIKRNCETVSTMRSYFEDVKLFMQIAGKHKIPIIFHVEPDMWGFFFQAREFNPADPLNTRVIVKSTGLAELQDLSDTVKGMGQAFCTLRDLYAPNVLLGWHASRWGATDPKRLGEFAMQTGNWDIIFAEVSDRDAEWRIANNYHVNNAWWDDNDYKTFARWSATLHQTTQRPLMLWQIPLGNTQRAACNNTPGHYMDNRVEYFFEQYPQNTHIAEYAQAGYIGLLFGGGAGGCTGYQDGRKDGINNPDPVKGNKGGLAIYPDDDGGYFREVVCNYYKHGPLLFK